MKIKNQISDITEEQRKIVLEAVDMGVPNPYDGKTLGQFLADQDMEGEPIFELYKALECYHLVWPFRLVNVDVEVKYSRRFTIPVLDDEVVDALVDHSLDVNALDPVFTTEYAYDEADTDILDGNNVEYDYSATDDRGHTFKTLGDAE